jgi:hypothetical protein
VCLSPGARRPYDVDRQSCRRRHEECGGVPNSAAIRPLPAQPGVLYDVLRLDGATQHPVGDPEEARKDAQKGREPVLRAGRQSRSPAIPRVRTAPARRGFR